MLSRRGRQRAPRVTGRMAGPAARAVHAGQGVPLGQEPEAPAGLWWSVTTGAHVGYESWLEDGRPGSGADGERHVAGTVPSSAVRRPAGPGPPPAGGLRQGQAPLMAGAATAGDPIAVLPALFHLMWRHGLTADLAARLTGETPVVAGTAPAGAR